MKTLQDAINDPFECGENQLRNWLKMLNEYIKRDTDMKVQQMCLTGQLICPACNEHISLGAENFCDKCGQKIKR